MGNPFPILRQRDMNAGMRQHQTERKFSPAIKGQITKAHKTHKDAPSLHNALMTIFLKLMPREQAKHAAKRHRVAYPVI